MCLQTLNYGKLQQNIYITLSVIEIENVPIVNNLSHTAVCRR